MVADTSTLEPQQAATPARGSKPEATRHTQAHHGLPTVNSAANNAKKFDQYELRKGIDRLADTALSNAYIAEVIPGAGDIASSITAAVAGSMKVHNRFSAGLVVMGFRQMLGSTIHVLGEAIPFLGSANKVVNVAENGTDVGNVGKVLFNKKTWTQKLGDVVAGEVNWDEVRAQKNEKALLKAEKSGKPISEERKESGWAMSVAKILPVVGGGIAALERGAHRLPEIIEDFRNGKEAGAINKLKGLLAGGAVDVAGGTVVTAANAVKFVKGYHETGSMAEAAKGSDVASDVEMVVSGQNKTSTVDNSNSQRPKYEVKGIHTKRIVAEIEARAARGEIGLN